MAACGVARITIQRLYLQIRSLVAAVPGYPQRVAVEDEPLGLIGDLLKGRQRLANGLEVASIQSRGEGAVTRRIGRRIGGEWLTP